MIATSFAKKKNVKKFNLLSLKNTLKPGVNKSTYINRMHAHTHTHTHTHTHK